MATATVARPLQALRTRRDAPRPQLPTKRAPVMDNSEPAAKRRKMDEPYVRTKEYILRKFAGKPPSLIVHLHPHYFRFEGQEGSFSFDSSMVAFIKHLRHQEIPHDMIEGLLSGNVPFYDGCLIVEVHNHRSSNGKTQGKRDSATGDQVKSSMHNYNNYVTPSGLTAFPKKAKENEMSEKPQAAEATKQEKCNDDKDKDDDGPHIATMVMFPTPLSQHKEMMLLTQTPASEVKSKKKSTDGSTTPQLSVPPTPLAASSRSAGQEQKMALEPQDFYQFQADVLLATEPTLYLHPAKNPREAQKVLDMLKHPLHSDPPPPPKTRKRTTAELAADDAQAAEAERRMLIMDERKTAAPGAADTAGNSQALGLNRFKTLQMVREKLDEAERQKKEEQEQAQAARKQEEAAAHAAQAQKQAQAEQQRKLMNQRQNIARQHHEQMRAQQMQQAALMAQNHAHPQQNGMMNQQQNNFQHPTSVSQSSPVVRQQTPMMNSSPMVAQGGFPMAATSSQHAGSPPRPTSAAMPNPNVAMARQASQQQHASRNGTPQMAQGTPNMPGAMPNRQMNQTPRLPHGSPAPGTPGTANMNMAAMPIQTPGQTTMTPEQFAMLQARQQQMQNQAGGINAGSPGQNPAQANMTPEQIQQIQQQQHRHRQQQLMIARAQAAAQNSNNPQGQHALAHRAYLLQQQQQQHAMQQRMLQAQQQQQQNNAGQAGSPHPGSMHPTPHMGHAHPQQGQGNGGGDANQGQQLTPQQQAQRQQQQAAQFRQASSQLQSLAQQYGGFQNIPQQIASSMPPLMRMVLQKQTQQQQTARAQQMAMRAQQAQNAGQAVAGTTSTPDPEYMATLRNHQSMLAQQQGAQMNGMSMTHNMNFGNMGNQQQFQGGQGDNLSQQFQAMHAALNRSQSGGGMGQ